MRNDRNTNNEFSSVPHEFIAPAGEKKTRTNRETERLTNRETERQKEEDGGGGWGGNKGREGIQCHLLTF